MNGNISNLYILLIIYKDCGGFISLPIYLHLNHIHPGGGSPPLAVFDPGGFHESELAIVFTEFFFLSYLSLFYTHCFSPASGILWKLKFCFPSQFGITRRNMKKINILFFYLNFVTYKADFRAFFCFSLPVFSRRSLEQPYSLKYLICFVELKVPCCVLLYQTLVYLD